MNSGIYTNNLIEREQYWIERSHKGHKHSEEFKIAMSKRLKGNQYNKGRKQTLEEIEQRRLSNIGKKRSKEARARMSAAQKGKIISEETRLKMRLAAEKRWNKEIVDKSYNVVKVIFKGRLPAS